MNRYVQQEEQDNTPVDPKKEKLQSRAGETGRLHKAYLSTHRYIYYLNSHCTVMVHYSTSKRATMGSKRKAAKAQGAARCEPSLKFQSKRNQFLLLLEEGGHHQEFKNCCYSSSSSVRKSLLLDFSNLSLESITKKFSSSTGTGMKSRNLVRVKTTTKIGNIYSSTWSCTPSTTRSTAGTIKINWIEEDGTSACGMDLFNVKKNIGSGVLTRKPKVGAGQSGDKLDLLHLSGASACVVFDKGFEQRKVEDQQLIEIARSKSVRLNLSDLADEQLASTFFALIP